MNYRKKLIEVALPLEAINREAAREKSIRHGHPSTLHLWWARRPLAACRAVLFASLVDDPSAHPELFASQADQERERERLFAVMEQLVKWENSNDAGVLQAARNEILRSCEGNAPRVLDPFCGGGSIPLEAQRLGLAAHASDLNPVAVLITRALIDIPVRFAGRAPVHPTDGELATMNVWNGAQGLADDIRYYGRWMRDEAERRIGALYPKIQLPAEHGGGETNVVAWIWARTVQSPNPAWNAPVPLVRSFALSTKKGGETWADPVVDHSTRTVRFVVRTGKGWPEGTVGRRGARCVATATGIPLSYVREEARAGRLGTQLMAIVADGRRGRIYLSPDDEHERVAASATPQDDLPDTEMVVNSRHMTPTLYGMKRHRDLFTKRQLVTLTTFSNLVTEAARRGLRDAVAAYATDDGVRLVNGGVGASAYADALATYLAFAVDKMVDTNSQLCTWQADPPRLRATFSRQALPMTWDYAETCPFAHAAGDYENCVDSLARVVEALPLGIPGTAVQLDARSVGSASRQDLLACTDPPYYDNVPYADLSDVFYVWLRRSLRDVFEEDFSTLLVPKSQEIVADPYRFNGDRRQAEDFFEAGIGVVAKRLQAVQNPTYPTTIFYAFKQAEGAADGAFVSTGWEKMLQGLFQAGFAVVGTWPMRSELASRMRTFDSNALASSIVLVCRPRPFDAPLTTRKDFLSALRAELPPALWTLQHASIAPVDLAQAAIGPGMGVFSRFSRVVEADGSAMTVRTALGLINQMLDEVLAEQDGDLDADTRFALAWFEQYGMAEGRYGQAETLFVAKGTSSGGVVSSGIVEARSGKVRLKRRDELATGWDPASDHRFTVWEATQQLIGAHEQHGEAAAAALLRRMGGLGESARDLAYRLFSICGRRNWAREALPYNALVVAWPEIVRLASLPQAGVAIQPTLGV